MPSEDDATGLPLRAHRERRGLTQLQVAEQLARLAWELRRENVGVNADMVSKWERGTKAVSPLYRELYCALFQTDGAALGFARSASPSLQPEEPSGANALLAQLGPAADQLGPNVLDAWQEEAMKRRTLLKMLGTTPAAIATPAHDSGRVSLPTATGLDDLADRYQSLYHSAAPLDLIAPVVTHLRTIDRLIRQGPTPAVRRRLLLNRSRVGTLAGRIAFFDLGDSLSARGYFTTAAEAAGEADEPWLAAAALGHMAFLPAAEYSFTAAQDYLHGAHRQVEQMPHDGIAAWLAAVESEILTNAGSLRLALTACDRGELLLDGSQPEQLPWFDYFDATRLQGFRGYTELQAGRLDDARRTLTAAAEGLPADAVKQRVVFLADMATVELERHNIDEACGLAIEAAEALRLAGYAIGGDRLRDLRRSLETRANHPGVLQIDELLAPGCA